MQISSIKSALFELPVACCVQSIPSFDFDSFTSNCTVRYLTSINAFHAYKNVSLEGEKWRRELVREITKKIAAIQNGK